MPGGCVAAPTFDSILCRIDALTAVAMQADLGNLKPSLLRHLAHAKDRTELAEQLEDAGNHRSASNYLKHARRRLNSFRWRIDSRTGRRVIDADTRGALTGMVEPISADAQTLLLSLR